MVTIRLKGVHVVSARGRTYWYAWRGGPRLTGEPGSAEFLGALHEAWSNRSRPKDDQTLRSLITSYKAGPFVKLSDTTQRNWSAWLDRIGTHFGTLRLAQFDRIEKIKPFIRRWRSQWADTPRSADYAIQVMSGLLAHGVKSGLLTYNACEGLERLYSSNRAEIIWTDVQIDRLKSAASPEIGYAVDLAAATGLRRGDLVRLSWSHVGSDAIAIPTGKSRRRLEAVIPLYADLRALLQRIPKRSTTVLTNSFGRPWSEDGLGTSFNKAKIEAGLVGENLHFNDLRGTAATRFYLSRLPIRAIAEMMGWEERSVERIIRRYVDRGAAVRSIIRQMDGGTKGEP